ncbi:MAG TPA: aldo/keto reductase [Tepidisphaeraceae bacterium]
MERRPFGQTGLQTSILGFGSSPAAHLNTDATTVTQMLNRLLDAGMNTVDTAASYPGSEKFIGEHLSHRRKDFILISKCGTKVEGVEGENWSRGLILQTVDRALRLLKTDVIDVMLLHTCDLNTLKKGEALGALVEAREAGKIRFAGFSGDNESAAYACAHPDVAVVEMSINIADQINLDVAIPEARKHKVGVIAKRPVANAAWKDPALQQGLYRGYSKPYTDRLAKMNLKPAHLGFSGPPEQSWPEIAIRFAISQPAVSTAVIGTTNPANAEANLAAINKGPLEKDVIEKLRAAFHKADPNGEWRGLT